MAKIKLTDSEKVTELIQNLNKDFGALVEEVRKMILAADPEVGEQVKWNSPAFYYTGEMKPFDPKEYKRDIVVMNLRNNKILLVFPTGAAVADTTGILEGNYADGRRMVTLHDENDFNAKKENLGIVIRLWISCVDK